MGFLDNLLRKGAKQIISGVVDELADSVADSAREVIGDKFFGDRSPASQTFTTTTNTSHTNTGFGEDNCGGNAAVVQQRIAAVLAKNFPGYELRTNIPAQSIGAGYLGHTYTLGIYKDGMAAAMINLLSNANDYKRKSILQSKQACKDQGLGYVHFILRLPNRTDYISQKLHEIL